MAEANFVNGALGTIAPSVLVVIDTTSWKAVNQANAATGFIIGVSQEYANTAPIPGATLNAATSPGDPIKVYQIGDVCLLNSTSAGWTAGDRLTSTSDSTGRGITATGTNYYGAIALSTMTGVGLGQVQIVLGKNP
jgi:hypothetical protein